LIGQTISHYRIFEKLGEGGMGAVNKAEDIRLKRTVVVKLLPNRDADPEARERFLREAQLAALLAVAAVAYRATLAWLDPAEIADIRDLFRRVREASWSSSSRLKVSWMRRNKPLRAELGGGE
jgi:serine/threonine protein kinase